MVWNFSFAAQTFLYAKSSEHLQFDWQKPEPIVQLMLDYLNAALLWYWIG